jgi:hypothetical protein
VAILRTVVSEERSASIIRVKTIGEQGTALAVTINANVPSSLFCFQPDNGGYAFLRNNGSYKSYDVTSLKKAFFIVASVKNSNLCSELTLN